MAGRLLPCGYLEHDDGGVVSYTAPELTAGERAAMEAQPQRDRLAKAERLARGLKH